MTMRGIQGFAYVVGLTGWVMLVAGGLWGIGAPREAGVPVGLLTILVGVLLIITGSILYLAFEAIKVAGVPGTTLVRNMGSASLLLGGVGWLTIIAGPLLAVAADGVVAFILALIVGSALVVLGSALFSLRQVRSFLPTPRPTTFAEKVWLDVALLGWLTYVVLPVYGFLTLDGGGVAYFLGGLVAGMGLFLLGTGAFIFLTLRQPIESFLARSFSSRGGRGRG